MGRKPHRRSLIEDLCTQTRHGVIDGADRRPDVRLHERRPLKAWGRHADDHERMPVERDGLTDDVGIGSESLRRQFVAEDHDRMRIGRRVVAILEQSSGGWPGAEHRCGPLAAHPPTADRKRPALRGGRTGWPLAHEVADGPAAGASARLAGACQLAGRNGLARRGICGARLARCRGAVRPRARLAGLARSTGPERIPLASR